jgi:hypothetical protein
MLRARHLPGETVEILLSQTGANREQAVGYLDDGTMVVVENAKNLIGQKMRVEIVRSLQTEAGRMMFAEKAKSSAPKVKPTTVFHSDQLKKQVKNPVKIPRVVANSNQNNKTPKIPHQTQKPIQKSAQKITQKSILNNSPRPLSAEDKMVNLANQNNQDDLR